MKIKESKDQKGMFLAQGTRSEATDTHREIAQALVNSLKPLKIKGLKSRILEIICEYEYWKSCEYFPIIPTRRWLEKFIETKKAELELVSNPDKISGRKKSSNESIFELPSFLGLQVPSQIRNDLATARNFLDRVSKINPKTFSGDFRINWLIAALIALREEVGLTAAYTENPYSEGNEPEGASVRWIQLAVKKIANKNCSLQSIRNRIKTLRNKN